jgi:ubiquinone biosynthesis protein UbiJ
MPEYRTPLPGLLATTLEVAINRALAMDENSPRRLAQLDQRLVRLELEGLGIVLNFAFSPQRVRVNLDADGEPDTVINGTPSALFSMAIPDSDGNWGTPGSRVRISGDATLARDLERLFSRLDPDWEARLSDWFGDVLGHQLAAGARGAAGQFRETVTTLGDITGDFLRRPDSPLAQDQEINEFGQAVDTLRDAAERLEARLRMVHERQAATSGPGEDEA